MSDRLISENAVKTLIETKIARLEQALLQKHETPEGEQRLLGQIGILRVVINHLPFIPNGDF